MDIRQWRAFTRHYSKAWRGYFSESEVEKYAADYKAEHDALGTESETIKTLLDNLEEDKRNGDGIDAPYWIENIKGKEKAK